MKFLYYTLILILFSFCTLPAQITFQRLTDVEVIKFPICRVQVKASSTDPNIEPIKENFIIKEMHFMSYADSVVKFDNDKYFLYWTSRLSVKFPYVDIYLTMGANSVTERFRMPKEYKLQRINVLTPTNKPMVFFNKPLPADSFTVGLTFKSIPDNSSEEYDNVKIDSMKTNTEYFKIQYRGSYKNWNPPPGVYPEGDYLFFVHFKGYEDRLYTDKLTIYYNGNQKTVIDLIANSYKVNTNNSITILKPKPGDIITPCFLDTIVWKGGNKGMNYNVELSTDGGYNWHSIGSTPDTFLIWKVESTETESAFIKVTQKFLPSAPYIYSDESGFTNVKYENNAKYLAVSNKIGEVNEIKISNITTQPIHKKNLLISDATPETHINTTGIVYSKITDDSRELAVTYHDAYYSSYFAKDILKIFKDEITEPIKTIPLEKTVKRIDVDSKYRFLTILYELSNKLIIYDTKDYTLKQELKFKYPISNFKYVPYGDSLQVVLYDNTIITLSSGDFKEVKRENFNYLPLLTDLATSADGLFTAFGSLRPPTEDLPHTIAYNGFIAPIYVFENSTLINIRAYFSNTMTPLGLDFGPASDRIIVGKTSKDHITMRELGADLPVDYFNFGIEVDSMLNYAFALEGHYVAGVMSDKRLYINKFSYSEIGLMDNPFAIRITKMDYNPIVLDNQILDYTSKHNFQRNFCNTGELPIIITDAHLKHNYMFSIDPSIVLPDTLYPGDCLNYTINYQSLDTGIVRDTLYFHSCAKIFSIPIESKVLPRNLTIYENELDFEEVCVWTIKKKSIKLLTNNDTIPLNIQNIKFENAGSTEFKLIGDYKNTIIPPGSDLIVEVQFVPIRLGKIESKLIIEHSNNNKFAITNMFKGTGIGVDIGVSHQDLAFIPEIKEREITIYNKDDKPFMINSYYTTPELSYKINTPLPITILPKDSATLKIEYLNEEPVLAKIVLLSEPCASNSNINLSKYSSNSTFSLLDTDADPRGEAVIKINLKNNEKVSYKGKRFLEGEFYIDEKIFLPYPENSVSSPFGTGKLIRNEVINGKRYIRFLVEGDFPKTGVIAEIKGYAGLTSPSESIMEFVPENKYFGISVNNNFISGIFKLINLCEDKLIIWQKPSINITTISPNPADNHCYIEFESNVETKSEIEIYNSLGDKIKNISNVSVNKGKNKYYLDINILNSGSYNLILRTNNEITNYNFIIVK